MQCLRLPKRVFNSPLLKYTNFDDGTHVNLIKLHKKYADGRSYAIHETTKSPFIGNGMYTTYKEALLAYYTKCHVASENAPILSEGTLGGNMTLDEII